MCTVNNVKGEIDIQRLPVDSEELKFNDWTIKYTKSHILHSVCTTNEKCKNAEDQCLLCLYTNTLELPHLPEMVFPNNKLLLFHSSGGCIEFNALDALRGVSNGKQSVKVAYSDIWKETRSKNMEETRMMRAARTTERHHLVIIEFLEENPEMLTRKFKSPHSRQNFNNNWEMLTEKLNSLGEGAKTQNQWQKVLSDWISRTKSKMANSKKSIVCTGGGPPKLFLLTEIEQRLLQLKGMSCIDGDGVTQEAGFKISSAQDAAEIDDTTDPGIAVRDSKVAETEKNVESGDYGACQSTTGNPRKRKLVRQEKKGTEEARSSLYLKMHKETLCVLKDIANTLKCLDHNFEKLNDNLSQSNQILSGLSDLVKEVV